MSLPRRRMSISIKGDSSIGYSNSKKQKKGGRFFRTSFLFLIFLVIVALFLLFWFENIPKGFKITMNEMEIRYDTFTISFDDSLPEAIKEEVEKELSKIEHRGKKRFSFVEDQADIEVGFVSEEDEKLYTGYLLPVGHFYWIKEGVDRYELEGRDIVAEEGFGDFTEAVLREYLGVEKKVEEKEDLLSYLKASEETSIGFVLFENINHEHKVLSYEDSYFFEELEGSIQFNIGVKIISAPLFLSEVIAINTEDVFTKVDLENIAKVNMTGVTALSRNLAFKIEASGDNAYPAQLIADFFADADIVHTSNEVSFVPNCQPERSMRFCSHPKYIEALEAINANVIELTGNHNNDFGAKYNTETIETYKEKGWDYYGGGLDTEDAQKILFKEVKGSKIAFVGYNYYDTIHNNILSLAGDDRAGANSFSFEKMERDIKKAKEENAFTIVTFQFEECWSYPPTDVIYPPCYKPLANPDQKKVFRAAIDYGADIVIGSQAHQPQTYEIYNGRPIFYGTGNLFFDQILWIGTRQGMILTHYIYENKLLQSRITTTIYDDDMRTYVTEGEERNLLLELLREARD